MPEIDVSPALENPLTLSTFNVLRRSEMVNGFGEVQIGSLQFSGVTGVVYPEGDQTLDREEDMGVPRKGIAVISGQFALRSQGTDASGGAWQPDLVVWQGNQYFVESLEDYSTYALGFVKAHCVLTDASPQPAVLATVPLAAGGAMVNLGKSRRIMVTLTNGNINLSTQVDPTALLFFRNGVLQDQGNADYQLQGLTIVPNPPLQPGDYVLILA